MDKYVCWNYETGFSIIDARHEDDAKLQCELNQPAVLLGEEREIKENMHALLDVESLRMGIRTDALRYCMRHRITGEMLIEQINERFKSWQTVGD